MKVVHLVAIAIACGDSLSSALPQRASPSLDPEMLDYIQSHAPLDDTPEQAVEFLRTDTVFHQKFPDAGKALAIRGQEPGLDPSQWVSHVAVSCITCMTGCLLRDSINWISGAQDPTTHRYQGGTLVDNSLFRKITVCGTTCVLMGSCTSAREAGTWQAQQDLSGMSLESKREIAA